MPQSNPSEAGINGVPADDFPEVGTEAWGQMNRKRRELIRKKLSGELTADELVLYEFLQRRSLEAVERAFPRQSENQEQENRPALRLKEEELAG